MKILPLFNYLQTVKIPKKEINEIKIEHQPHFPLHYERKQSLLSLRF